jgi:hypothetical protein
MSREIKVSKRSESKFVSYITAVYCIYGLGKDKDPVSISSNVYRITREIIKMCTDQHMWNLLNVFSSMNDEQINAGNLKESERLAAMQYISVVDLGGLSISHSKSYQQCPYTLGHFEVPFNSPTKSQLEKLILRTNRAASASSN